MKQEFVDSLGRAVEIDYPPGRVVALCPCLTETLFALGLGERIVGRTAYCVHPAERVAGVPVVGGPKDVDVAAVLELKPDLVIAAKEENRRETVAALEAGNLTPLPGREGTGEGRSTLSRGPPPPPPPPRGGGGGAGGWCFFF
ncbi:MAG: helical backbone metal receptor, partial [Planctomycetota bacterium]